MVLSKSDKLEENENEEKMRELVGDRGPHQFFIPVSFPLHLGFGGPTSWEGWMQGGNAMWNWGMVCRML